MQHGSCHSLQSEPWGIGQGYKIERFEGQVSDVSHDSSSQLYENQTGILLVHRAYTLFILPSVMN